MIHQEVTMGFWEVLACWNSCDPICWILALGLPKALTWNKYTNQKV